MELAKGLDVGCERKTRDKNNSKIFWHKNQRVELSFFERKESEKGVRI